MQETEIKNRLESLLGTEGLVIQVVEQEGSLFVILNRSGTEHLNYTTIVNQVVDEIELNYFSFQSIQFYSRVLGEHEPDWARTIPLGEQTLGNATVIVSSARSAPTVIEDLREDDQSTKLVPPPVITRIIEEVADSSTTIEEDAFNLPKPKIPSHRPKRPKPEENPPEPQIEAEPVIEQDNSAATEIAVAPPKPKVKQPEPIVQPVVAPFPVQKLVISVLALAGLVTIGWFAWAKLRPSPKPKPKKAEIVTSATVKVIYPKFVTYV